MDALHWSTLLAHWNSGRGPLYAQLGAAIQGCVSGGQLAPGEALPSERRLAELLQVSRSTVVAAYEELATGGWVSRRQGSGTHVAPLSPGQLAPRQGEVLALRTPLQGSPAWGQPVRGTDVPDGELDLTVAVPVLGTVQQARLERAAEGAFRESLYHPLGLPDLRAEVAAMYIRQGLPTRPEQVVVTTGAQQAISLIAGALLRRGDAALLETPTYFGAIDVFRAAGARLLGVSVLHEEGPGGLTPADFASQLGAAPRLAFLTPTFQNPTGDVMPATTRARLARMIADAGLPTIEDDSLIDLGFDRPDAPPRLASFEPGAPVICVGSFSKLFWAGLRVGWMRLPGALTAQITQHKTLADFGSSVPSQAIALRLLQDLSALKAERRSSVQPARDLLVALLGEHLPDWSFRVPSGGQFLWAGLPTRNASGFTHVARRYGVRLFPGASMGVTDLPDSFLRLPFTLPVSQLPEAVRRLRLAWASFQERGAAERLA